MPRCLIAVVLSAILSITFLPLTASADTGPDFDVAGGHFFSQTNQTTLGPSAGGYSVSDLDGIPFWTYFNSVGGPAVLGYPVSRRFLWNGYVCQATQRAIMQWNPTTRQVQLVNVFDELSSIGKDAWLSAMHLAPPTQQSSGEAQAGTQPLPFLLLAHFRFGWLYQDPSIFQRYFNTPDYYDMYGLPTSSVEDLGPYWAARFQRVVMYHWKSSVPWADNAGVAVGLAGDLYKELGGIPPAALQLEDMHAPDAGTNLPSIGTVPAAKPAAPGISSGGSIVPRSPTAPPVVAPNPAPAVGPSPAPISTSGSTGPVLVGIATWYGASFQGQKMADGSTYDMNNPTTTAANAYPLGTWLRVTRLTTGRSILVQVTDRGGFRYPDIVDLSYAAFSELADPSEGVIAVRVEPVS